MVINMVTKKEYETAIQNVVFLQDAIVRENGRRENLINELCSSQKMLADYKKALKKQGLPQV